MGNNFNYNPKPFDTSDIQIPEQLQDMIEFVAKNVHEVWAKNRIDQGWQYGEKRNDDLKLHPGLVPYELLPEEEKNYDRSTAKATIKTILKMGLKITK